MKTGGFGEDLLLKSFLKVLLQPWVRKFMRRRSGMRVAKKESSFTVSKPSHHEDEKIP